MQLGTTSIVGANPAGQVIDLENEETGRNESDTLTFPTSKSFKASTTTTDSAPSEDTMIAPLAGVPISTSSPHTNLPPHLISEAPNIPPTRSRPSSRDTSPYPRSRPSTPNRPSTPGSSVASSSRAAPPRRSARTLAKGPDRPRGPPELEAALAIAIRNMESDIYEWWCANQKPGSPIPTTAYLKARSPRIRRAAEAVDQADRLLNEAVYGKPRKGRSMAKRSQISPNSPSGEIPETAFEQLELNSHGNSPLRPKETKTLTKPGGSDGQPRRSTRNKESIGDS